MSHKNNPNPKSNEKRPERLLLVSALAFYPLHWDAFRELCLRYDVVGSVIADAPPYIPNVHRQLGWVDAESAKQESFSPEIRVMPQGDKSVRKQWLAKTLDELKPDAIWVQEEPFAPILLDLLKHYEHDLRPRIVTAACENIFWQVRWWERKKMSRLWSRLNGLLATAGASAEGARKVGMPNSVPAPILVAGGHAPPENIEPMDLPFVRQPDDFVIGFCGRICREKGWKVLLKAVQQLPQNFKVLMASDGPDVEELKTWLQRPEFAGRVFHLGAVPKQTLWRFYKSIDCFVLPSLTKKKWKEQFGGVLADAMVMGLPIIGSDSGSIPEVIGPAGIVTPEGDSDSLARAIRRMTDEPGLIQRLSQAGRSRFAEEFSMVAYAGKIARSLGLSPLADANQLSQPLPLVLRKSPAA